MKNSTRIALAWGALLSAGMLLAQAPGSNQPPAAAESQSGNRHRDLDPSQQAAHLGKQLGLSSDQVAQITPILADRRQKIESLRLDNSLTPQDRRIKARTIVEDANSKIEALLSDSQKQQFEQMLANRRNRRQDRQSQPQTPQS